MLALLFAALGAAAVLFVLLRLRRKYWPLEKAPFWFEVLQLAAIILTAGNKRQRYRFPSLIKLFQFWIVV